jgi:hypothetical protein
MLNTKTERGIFIIIFVIILFVVSLYATQLKYNTLPINKGLSAEQVIEQEYPELKRNELQYKYVVIDKYLFVCRETYGGVLDFSFAFKNENSGFMFDIPGLKTGGTGIIIKSNGVNLPDSSIFYIIYKVQSDYIVEIEDLKNLDLSIFCDENQLDHMAIEGQIGQYWVIVIKDIDSPKEIYCLYKGEKLEILNSADIKALFGEE